MSFLCSGSLSNGCTFHRDLEGNSLQRSKSPAHSAPVTLASCPRTCQTCPHVSQCLHFCFLSLESHYPGNSMGCSLPFFRFLLICHLIRETFSGHSIQNYITCFSPWDSSLSDISCSVLGMMGGHTSHDYNVKFSEGSRPSL